MGALRIGAGVRFTDTSFPFVNPVVLTGNNGRLDVSSRPKWTTSVYPSYETEPFAGDMTMQFRMDGQHRSYIQFLANPTTFLLADGSNANGLGTKPFMLVNGRVALRHIKIGPAEAELAFWTKNLTNRKDASFSLAIGAVTSMNYLPPRTFGVDLSMDF